MNYINTLVRVCGIWAMMLVGIATSIAQNMDPFSYVVYSNDNAAYANNWQVSANQFLDIGANDGLMVSFTAITGNEPHRLLRIDNGTRPLEVYYASNTLRVRRFIDNTRYYDYTLYDILFLEGQGQTRKFNIEFYFTATFMWAKVKHEEADRYAVFTSPIFFGLGADQGTAVGKPTDMTPFLTRNSGASITLGGPSTSVSGRFKVYAFKYKDLRREIPHVIGMKSIFAIVGDYGCTGDPVRKVADMVKSWQPEYILSVGDDNYANVSGQGCAGTIDANVGQYYHEYISPYSGNYGSHTGTETPTRFFPTPGNHDYASGITAWDNFFGVKRYDHFTQGNIQFFKIDTNNEQPDGNDANSWQAQQIKHELESSTAKYKIVYMHTPPYSTLAADDNLAQRQKVRWPFKDWGADLVIAGDDHYYERRIVDSLTYVVNGLGGYPVKKIVTVPEADQPQVKKHFDAQFGAMRVFELPDHLHFEFVSIDREVADGFDIYPSSGGHQSRKASPEIAVINKKETSKSFQVYPNPSSGEFTVSFALPADAPVDIDVTDLVGKRVYHRSEVFSTGNHAVNIVLPPTSAGAIMLVTVKTSTFKEIQKVLIK